MKNQALFSSKDKSKKNKNKNLKCRLLQFLFGALGVKMQTSIQTALEQHRINIGQRDSVSAPDTLQGCASEIGPKLYPAGTQRPNDVVLTSK